MLDLDEAVRLQRRAGLHEVDDVAAQTKPRRQLDRAVQLDAFGLDTARRKMALGDRGIFCRDAQMAPTARVLAPGPIGRRGNRHVAMPDIEIERRIYLRIIELHQDVVAGDAELRRTKRDKARNIEAADADQIEPRIARRKAQLAARRVAE